MKSLKPQFDAEDALYYISKYLHNTDIDFKRNLQRALCSYPKNDRDEIVKFLKNTAQALAKENKKYSNFEKMAEKQKLLLTKENNFV